MEKKSADGWFCLCGGGHSGICLVCDLVCRLIGENMAEIFTQILNVVVLGLIAVIVVYAARALDKYTKRKK